MKPKFQESIQDFSLYTYILETETFISRVQLSETSAPSVMFYVLVARDH